MTCNVPIWNQVETVEWEEMIKIQPKIILDCRPEEFTNVVKFIQQPNLAYVPLSTIQMKNKQQITDIIKTQIINYDEKDTIYVFCRSGVTSKEAVYIMKNIGLAAVNVRKGLSGFKEWSGKDFNTLE